MITGEQQRAFDDWRELATRAAETKALADAVASGKAFVKFHYLFIEVDFRPTATASKSKDAA
ncbi:MAG: hypothetical protein EOS54_04365 [Mesorhizobium sp.]|uniref:hypothetical protein n=1 Tax=unclassified Mesorhizobium TaxID=325217 RepID=UPI000F74C1C2|nr:MULTISPECIES: hypothetical protein [unclassified Mesorhizobium]AZO47087.1 hypothetical protein EJ073_04040 [Mesorhizobium sp. M4B.F.Ca.ET.058.02.1.1]RWC57740.1 MAG: hypothetical protein EOS54_04365 [Mesorhizobium sp.]RWD13821.1 MAG: hypothetical protein EOS74_17625 [Mesorhizobium sp.]RWD55536.1 MAG: hypothetical protein EOS75_16350 [Mesorhizobium sp.]TIU72274.1 MAG: hypothetical protein E5W25_01245 [Mesorhizobium sp.]